MTTLKQHRVWNLGALGYVCISLAVASTQLACGASDDSPSGTGGNRGNPGTGGSTSMPPSCDGAFAKLPLPYSANTAFDDMSAFIADAQGLVFSALPDDNLGENASELPNVLMASDLSGNVSTLREAENGFFSNPVLDGDDVIVAEGFLTRKLVRLSRTGGGGETVLDEGIRQGPFADESSLYYFADGDSGGTVLFSLPRAGGTRKVLADRGTIGFRGFALDGDTLYWGEQEDFLGQSPLNIYSMKVNATEPSLLATIPSNTAGGLNASGGLLFSTLLSDSYDILTFRVDAGKAPAPMGETGLPFILADGKAYYGGSGGITRNTLTFDAPTTVSGTSGKSIYAIASGPTDLWYATLGCLFRTAK